MALQLVIEQRRRDLGGFEVGRVLPFAKRQMVGPFIFFDHFGPAEFPRGIPRTVDVRPHPHIGLSTVTYLFEGEIMHRDSVGSEQAIHPGEVNWMVAGRGITHSERFEKARAEGGTMHGIQAWVALPREDEETAPQFANYSGSALPTHEQAGAWMRLIAGEIGGVRAGALTHSSVHRSPCRRVRGLRRRRHLSQARFVASTRRIILVELPLTPQELQWPRTRLWSAACCALIALCRWRRHPSSMDVWARPRRARRVLPASRQGPCRGRAH